MKLIRTVGLLGFALVSGGCAASAEDPVESGRVGLTIVHLNPDGTSEVQYRMLTPAQAKSLDAAKAVLQAPEVVEGSPEFVRAQQAIANDSGCAGASIWLYTGTSQTGDRICFSGSGTAVLSNYFVASSCSPICWQTWGAGGWNSAPVKSLWAPSSSGLSGDLGGLSGEFYSPCSPGFTNNGAARDTNTCEQGANRVRQF